MDRLIAAGKCKQAVELAKEEHKRRNTPESEHRLVQAYLARIEQFQNKGMAQDAETLLALVRQRFPTQQGRLKQLEARAAAAGGRVADLVAPLASAATAAELCACIESTIRQDLIDLPALAGCDALPADHSLRVAAAAIWRALEAATTGPVTEEQVALPEVSRRSPLAGWKMLVRAIAACYRNDDEASRRALDAIPADAAARRLAPVLRAMMSQTAPATGLAGALHARVMGDDRPLRAALDGIERAFQLTDLSGLKRCIREAVRACSTAHPELLERLKQHISIACVLQQVPVDEVVRTMGPSRKDAYFWRLLARASELEGAPILAALYWERFLRHAVHQRMIAPRSLEAAMVYLHAAGLLRGISLVELREARRRLNQRGIFRAYYQDQPPEIAALMPPTDEQVVETVLSPGWLYERAAAIHPDPTTFRQWWSWAEEIELPDRLKEDIARRWQESQPRDPQPLLTLSLLAERRNALKLAMKHLAAAEKRDALHPQVRRARVRLTLATTWRHFKDNKPHLLEKDLAELAALPGMDQGDRAAFLTALRAAWHALRHDAAAANADVQTVLATMGALAGGVTLNSVAGMASLPKGSAWPALSMPALPDPHEVIRAEARTIRLALDLGLRIVRPTAWNRIINDVLREPGCPLAHTDLLAIARAAVGRGEWEQAYLASAAGLATPGSPAATARYLLLRAQSLTAPWAQGRATQCLHAALQLARQAHDAELLQDVFAQIDRHPHARHAIASGEGDQSAGDGLLAEVLKNERDARCFPGNRVEADRYLAVTENQSLGRLGDFSFGDEEEDEDELDERDFGGFDPMNVPRSLEGSGAQMEELLEPLRGAGGRLPSPSELLDSPELLLRLLAAMGGAQAGDANLKELLDEFADEPPKGFLPNWFRRRGKRKKKGR